MLRTDAHQHFWRIARGDFAWLRADDAAVAPLLRDFLPVDLAPLLEAHGVSRTVLVQATESVAETEFLLALAAEHDFVAGVVGWVDLADDGCGRVARPPRDRRPAERRAPDAAGPARGRLDRRRAPARRDARAATPRPALRRAGQAAPARGPRAIRARMARPAHRDRPCRQAADRVTAWNDEPMRAWRRDMAACAQSPQVACKLSGLLTELRPADAASRAGAPPIGCVPWSTRCSAGSGRRGAMWGSDWPALTLAGGYDDWVAVSGRPDRTRCPTTSTRRCCTARRSDFLRARLTWTRSSPSAACARASPASRRWTRSGSSCAPARCTR